MVWHSGTAHAREGIGVAYDKGLAERVRAVLAGQTVTEQQMFGGLAFMIGGHMACGVVKDTLMVRLGPEAAGHALERPHVRQMDFTGRPMKGMVFVEPAGLNESALRHWAGAAAEYARGLPPKQASPARKRRQRPGR
jgi:TfoX N-terminal domain